MMRNEGVAGRTDSRSWAEAMPMVGGVEGPASAGRGRAMWVSRVRAAHLWWCVAKTPVPMNSMARETPWFDDEAVVPAFGGPAALREAVPWAVVPMCGTGWVASPARRGGMIGASVSGGEIVMCWDAVVQDQHGSH